MPLSPTERSLRAKAAVYTRLAQEDPKVMTAAARRGFRARFYKDIPEDLPAEERERRADAACSAYMSKLRLRQSRGTRAAEDAGRELADLADGDA
jgi:hypothetical protein